MIAREWRAEATPDGTERYAQHFRSAVVPRLRQLSGFRDAFLATRRVGDRDELVVISLWDSLTSVADFAGDDINRAVVAPEAAEVLTSYEETVRHWDLRS